MASEKKDTRILVNGHKPNKGKFWVHCGWQLLSLTMVVVIAVALSKTVNVRINNWTSSWMINSTDVFDLLENHPWVNVFFFLWLLAGVALYVWKNRNNKYFSGIRVGLAFVISVFVLSQDVWTYANTPLAFLGYDWFVAIVAWGFIVWSVVRCVSLEPKPVRTNTRKIIMTSDEISDVEISPARRSYAELLVNELLTSNLYKETYAVAITGAWGSGKSLFLETVKDLCKEKAIVIDFNPWNSQDGDHLLKDFFNVLSSNLSPYYSGVKKTMGKYVSLLYSLRLNVTGNFTLQPFPVKREENIETNKQEVANALKNIQKPIIIAIDDLDRLAGKEIFEVLRIIRNTAKFNNIIYIVTYDKEHVIRQFSLPGLGIEKDYLEKIFQIELSMPKVDEKMLKEDFQLLCRNGVNRTKHINAALSALTEEDYNQIFKVLWSYRKVKRFVRQFSFNTNFMVDSFVDGASFPLKDVMFLNIIQATNYQLYQKMWLEPEKIFVTKLHPYTKCQYYALRDDDKSVSENYFMKQLFGGVPDKNPNSLQKVDAYYKYFYLSQPESVLSKEDFNEMLKLPSSENATVGMRSTIRGWVRSKDSKGAPSIYACFANSNPKIHVDPQETRGFLSALFYWLEYEDRANANLENVLPHLLKMRLYELSPDQQIDAYAMSLMNKWLYKGNYEKCAKILVRLFVEIDGGTKLLLDKAKVEKAIATNVDTFLKSQEWDAVLLFRSDDNPMLRFVKVYCVKTQNNMKRMNLVIDKLIAFFSEPKHKSQNLDEVEKYKESFASYGVYGKTAGSSVDWDEMTSIFGDNMTKAIEYIEMCFRERDKPKS